MRRATAILLVASLPAGAQVTKASVSGGSPSQPPPITVFKGFKVAPGSFKGIERRFNEQLTTLFDLNEPLDLLGPARGISLEGYGIVFTAELSLVMTPGQSPFRQTIPPQAMKDKIRQRKIERLPKLKETMKDMMRTAAKTFIQVPLEQQIVFCVRFLYEPWEDRTGMPSQILMKADRKSAAAGDIQVEEQ